MLTIYCSRYLPQINRSNIEEESLLWVAALQAYRLPHMLSLMDSMSLYSKKAITSVSTWVSLLPDIHSFRFCSSGGIWSSVNKTSGLQLNSLLYRFFPAVKWHEAFPHRDEIVGGDLFP